jgi:hypothetical protein
MGWIFWVLVFSVPIFGMVYAGYTSYLKYRQHRAMLDVLKVYAERGEAPPEQVLSALSQGFSLSEPGVNAPNRWASEPSSQPAVQGPTHYWSLFGLFAVLGAGFGHAAYMQNWSPALMIVAATMGAVAVWAAIMAMVLSMRKK